MNEKKILFAVILFFSVSYGLTGFARENERIPQINNGSASLIFFYFGDSPFQAFFQGSPELQRVMNDYKKVILLKEETPDGLKVGQKALDKADTVAMPTKENIIKYLKELTAEGYFIDIWIFSYGFPDGFRVYDAMNADKNGIFSAGDIRSLPEVTGYKYIPVRMVFQTNSYGHDLIDDWRKAGAKVALGARQVSFFPYEFFRFTEYWNKGEPFKLARDKANCITQHPPVYTYISMIMAPAAEQEGKWGGCPAGYNILGTTEEALQCAQNFFTTESIWAGRALTWRGSTTATMDYSNFKMVAGDYRMTKNTVPEW